MATTTFEKLEVWKRSCRQAVEVIKLTKKLNPHSLRDQLQRAAISVPSNIAEGSERDTKPDFIRFIRIAKGSNAELRTQIYLAAKLDELSKSTTNALISESKEIASMLQGLAKALRKQADSAKLKTEI